MLLGIGITPLTIEMSVMEIRDDEKRSHMSWGIILGGLKRDYYEEQTSRVLVVLLDL